MKRIPVLFAFLLIPFLAFSQFEQKISVNLSGGIFSTVGAKTYMPDYGTSPEDEQPTQLANYKPGVYASLGIQYNINRHFSIQTDAGIMIAQLLDERYVFQVRLPFATVFGRHGISDKSRSPDLLVKLFGELARFRHAIQFFADGVNLFLGKGLDYVPDLLLFGIDIVRHTSSVEY